MHWKTVVPKRIMVDSRLALMEMRVVLASLIWYYEFELVEWKGRPELNHVSMSAGELELRIRRRRVEEI